MRRCRGGNEAQLAVAGRQASAGPHSKYISGSTRQQSRVVFSIKPTVNQKIGRSQSKRKGPESARAASRAEHVILCRTLMIEILAVLCWGGGSSQFSLSEKGESQYLLPPQISGIDTRTLKPSDPYCVPTVNWSLCDFVQIVKLHSPAFGYSLLFA